MCRATCRYSINVQGGILALDPIIDERYFLYALKFSNAGLAIATRTFWLRAMKETYENPEFKDLKLPGLYVPSEGGEPLSGGEEKALNRWLRDIDAGVHCRLLYLRRWPCGGIRLFQLQNSGVRTGFHFQPAICDQGLQTYYP